MRELTKLRLQGFALRQLRSLVWKADEWIYAKEQRLQVRLAVGVHLEPARAPRPQRATVPGAGALAADEQRGGRILRWLSGRSQSQRPAAPKVGW